MADNNNQESRSNPNPAAGSRRSGGRRRTGKQRQKKFPSQENIQVCPLCGQNVRDVLTAISIDDTGTPAHFDCVLKKLAAQEELKVKEKICYLGKGEFGVVRFKGNNSIKFEIVKRLTVEAADKPIPWRKEIGRRLKK